MSHESVTLLISKSTKNINSSLLTFFLSESNDKEVKVDSKPNENNTTFYNERTPLFRKKKNQVPYITCNILKSMKGITDTVKAVYILTTAFPSKFL